MRLRGKEKSNEINIDVDMKRTCHTYQTLIHHDFKKGEMQHADYIDKRTGQRSVRGTPLKLGNSVDIRLEATELPKVEPYTVVELEEAVYAPYVQRGNFPVLVEKITCKGIRPVANKNMQAVKVPVLVLTYQTAG